jgi:hypothetical protein
MERYKCFFNSAEKAYFEQTDSISTLKHLHCRKYSFPKLTQFIQEVMGYILLLLT